jgi:hypothetical protein
VDVFQLKEQAAAVKKKGRQLFLFSMLFYLKCLSGQTAQLVGFSTAGRSFTADIIAVKEKEFRRCCRNSQGQEQE